MIFMVLEKIQLIINQRYIQQISTKYLILILLFPH